jgi:hypothetical protein
VRYTENSVNNHNIAEFCAPAVHRWFHEGQFGDPTRKGRNDVEHVNQIMLQVGRMEFRATPIRLT